MDGTPGTEIAVERRQRSDGRRSRDAILDTAARLATVEGLDGLSIGNLAERTGMSKSGLYAHFKSKEELQLATIERADEIFAREVLDRARAHPEGLPRLWALADEFLSHIERDVFPGGCFFAAVGGGVQHAPGPRQGADPRLQRRVVRGARGRRRAGTGGRRPARVARPGAGRLRDQRAPADGAPELHMLGDPALLERARRGLERLLGPRPASRV